MAATAAPAPNRALPHALSVDVEDYFQVEAFADRITPEDWPQFPRRVADNTRRVLEIFARRRAQATFFVLGWVAEREPKLIREILSAGHEVGCHSYRHRCIWRMRPEEFRADTRRAVAAIEDAGGQKVVGYRAPTFSIVAGSLWAIRILAEEGFTYDSSVFPIRHDLYGIPDAPRFCFQWRCSGDLRLFEIPPSTVRIWSWNLPVAGGGYLRILPMWYTRWALRRMQKTEARPLTVYFHPWEIDPAQPRLPGSWKSRLRHYRNLGSMESRLCELLDRYRFVSFRECLNDYIRDPLPQMDVPSGGLQDVNSLYASRL